MDLRFCVCMRACVRACVRLYLGTGVDVYVRVCVYVNMCCVEPSKQCASYVVRNLPSEVYFLPCLLGACE